MRRFRDDLCALLIGLGLLALLTIPRMWQPGMFVDGVTYAAAARNMAEGQGTLWEPRYTGTLYAKFHEQPPLGLGLESLAFRLAGDHLAVERVYSVLMASLTALFIGLLFRRATGGWPLLPLLFWVTPAVVTWAIVNNMLETTQALFTTLALYAVVRGLEAPPARSAGARSRSRDGWAVLAGAACWAAMLAKGPVGFFPLAAPVFSMAVFDRSDRPRAARVLVVMFLTVLVGGVLAVAFPGPRENLSGYALQHLFPGVAGQRETAPRWSILRHLAAGAWLRMVALLAILALVQRRLPRPDTLRARWAAWFALVGLSASLPIAVSAKMAGHYLVPAMPCFALAFASLVARPGTRNGTARGRILQTVAAGVLLGASVAIPVAFGPLEPRDVGLIQELRAIGPSLPRGGVIGVCESARSEWGLHAYFQRLYGISLDAEAPEGHDLFLQLNDRGCKPPTPCAGVVAQTKGFTLHRCADGTEARPR